MSQSHSVDGTSQVPGRIIKHKDAKAVSGFQSGLFYAYGPLYEEIKVGVPAGEANPEAEADLHLRQSITQVAWTYFVEQTRRDPDLMNEIKDIQIGQEQIIMSDNSPDLEGQAEWEGNLNGTEPTRSGDQQNAIDEEMIKGYYMSKIEEVIEEAKSAYDDATNIDEMLESSRFKYMMINHGCLFLLQMFVFLGLGVNKLKNLSGLSDDLGIDILFGSDIMFAKCAVFPGNQIPLVVLNKLIQSSFFEKVVLMVDWKKPSSSDVVKCVLYDLILDPVLKKSPPNRSSTFSDAQNKLSSTQGQITDILHGLHSRLVGTARGDIKLQHGTVVSEVVRIDSSRNNMEQQSDGDNQRIPSSVTEMYSKGMHFKGVSGMAISEINIKGSVFTRKVLHLPVFTFNEMTKYLYTCLKDYENEHDPREKVVNDYLQFLRDIVRCDQDVVLLEQKGVIEVDYHKVQIDEVVEYLRKVADPSLTCTTHHLRTLKLGISHHLLKPWYYKYLTGVLFSIIISILSLTFGILGYFLERSRKT